MSGKQLDWIYGLAVGGLVLTVYSLTCSPWFLSCGDTGELMTVDYTLGVAHAPGYPLYTLLWHFFSCLPLGTIAHRLALGTAFIGSLTAMNLYVASLLLTGRRSISALAALTLAFSFHSWMYSMLPEVMALTGFFISCLLVILLSMRSERPGLVGSPELFMFVVGLSLAHQYSVLFCAPAALVYLYLARPDLRHRITFRQVLIWAGLLAAGLSPNLYLLVRGPQMPYMNAGTITSFGRFVDHITRKTYGTFGLTSQYSQWTLESIPPLLGFYATALWRSFGIAGILIAGMGSVWLYRRYRDVFYLWLLAFVFIGPLFTVMSHIPVDKVENKAVLDRYLLNSFVVFSLAMGPGMLWMTESLPALLQRFFEIRIPDGKIISWILACGIPIWLLIHDYPVLNFREIRISEAYGNDLFKSVAPGAIVIADADNALFTLCYLQKVEGQRPDVALLNASMDPLTVEQVRHHYPDILLTPGIFGPDLVRDIIRLNIGKRPIYTVGAPGQKFGPYGILGNPFTVQPSGLAIQVVARADPAFDDSALWRSFEYQTPLPLKPNSPYFLQDLNYGYGLARYNAALLYNQVGRSDRACVYAHTAGMIDSFFLQLPLAQLQC